MHPHLIIILTQLIQSLTNIQPSCPKQSQLTCLLFCFIAPTKTEINMTLQKVVIRVTMVDQKKSRTEAMKIAATAFGVQSVALGGDGKDEIQVTGEGIDTVKLAKLLRKKIGSADLLSVGPAAKAEEKKKEEKKDEATVVPLLWGSQPYYYNSYPVVYAHDHYDSSPSCTLM